MGAYEAQDEPADSPAEFDVSCKVDGVDFLVWQRGYGTLAPDAMKEDGDGDDDFDIDDVDLGAWESSFGLTDAQSASDQPSAVSGAPMAASAERPTRAELIDAAISYGLPEFSHVEVGEFVSQDESSEALLKFAAALERMAPATYRTHENFALYSASDQGDDESLAYVATLADGGFDNEVVRNDAI